MEFTSIGIEPRLENFSFFHPSMGSVSSPMIPMYSYNPYGYNQQPLPPSLHSNQEGNHNFLPNSAATPDNCVFPISHYNPVTQICYPDVRNLSFGIKLSPESYRIWVNNNETAQKQRLGGVTRHRNPPATRKPWTIAHENGQKCTKS